MCTEKGTGSDDGQFFMVFVLKAKDRNVTIDEENDGELEHNFESHMKDHMNNEE